MKKWDEDIRMEAWSEGLWWNRTTSEKRQTTASPNVTGKPRRGVESRTGARHGHLKALVHCGQNTVSEMLERADLRVRIAKEKVG